MGVTLRCGAATFVLVLAGCGGGGGEHDKGDAKPSAGAYAAAATTGPGAPVSSAAHPPSAPDEAEAQVLKVYDSMWAEQMKAYRAASAEGTDLKLYMAPDALGAVEADLDRMNKERTQMRGDLRHAPEVTTLALGARPPTATVRDCVDSSRWQTLDTTTGWRLPPPAGQPVRYVVTAKAEHGERWTVTEYAADRTRPC
ncbi:secreted protein/lipoprotein [Streptomyces sp. NPDC102451]|uniref:secreted protein/lipoprotein n=1 Tax=Streptomyces sp. NPDC102451 TaxID=3366177 RepID=UPI00381319FC